MATQTLYGLGIEKLFKQSIDWTSDTIKVALLTSAYNPNQDTDEYWSEISANEIVGTNYTAGGETLGTKSISYDAATNEIRVDAGDVAWSNATITARYAVIYKDTGDPATSPLIAYITFDADKSASAGAFNLIFAANSVFKGTV